LWYWCTSDAPYISQFESSRELDLQLLVEWGGVAEDPELQKKNVGKLLHLWISEVIRTPIKPISSL